MSNKTLLIILAAVGIYVWMRNNNRTTPNFFGSTIAAPPNSTADFRYDPAYTTSGLAYY